VAKLLSERMFMAETARRSVAEYDSPHIRLVFENWRGRDGNDPSFDIAKDAERRF
jgi:hypothetical protein